MKGRICWHRNIYGDYFTQTSETGLNVRMDDEDVLNLLNKNSNILEMYKILKKAMEEIAKTDTAKDYDFTWLHKWRSETKKKVASALKEASERRYVKVDTCSSCYEEYETEMQVASDECCCIQCRVP